VVPTLPARGTTPAARTGLGGAGEADRTTARTARPAPSAAPAAPRRAAAVRPVTTLVGGLLPDGRVSDVADPREEDLLLLGSLLGGEPVRTLPAGADDPDAAGMPAGGSDVPPATPAPAPATSAPATAGRTFSDGRPVAGPDPDYR
jgi:hypothetical protein